MRTSKTVTTKTYAIAKHTVTFVADGVTVKTMTVDDGYVLKASDYPAVPAKAGYIGSWNKYNGSITSDRTIQASYRLPNRCVVTFKVENTVLKTMTVDEGYVLTAFDYPAIPPKPNCHTIWSYHTKPITADTTVTGAYIPNEGPDITIPPTPTTPPDIEFASVGDEEDVEESQADNASAEDAVSATAANSPVMELISTVTERHDYIYAGGKLLRETITTTAANGTVSTQILDFTYDATGSPYSLTYTSGTSTTVFYYITNLQGDVVSLLNASGDEVAAYTYDPYGRPVTIKGRVGTTLQTITDPTHIANLNPLRYRGYYYDNETGFYYLQSRYYDPAICRFINADGYASTSQGFTGYNMFAYCNNSPANGSDPSGCAARGNLTVAVCDGGHSPSVISTTDGYVESERLVDDFVSNNHIPANDGTVYMNVEHVGIYSKRTDYTVPLIRDVSGVAISVAPFVFATGPIGSCICAVAGPLIAIHGLISTISSATDPLADRDYDVYKVTMSWTLTTPMYAANPESGYYNVTEYTDVAYYVWNDNRRENEYWHCISYSCTVQSVNVYIP